MKKRGLRRDIYQALVITCITVAVPFAVLFIFDKMCLLGNKAYFKNSFFHCL